MVVFLAVLLAVTPCVPGRGGVGHQLRSRTEKAAFQRSHPCPSTRRRTGACPGWVVDHRVPLVCCGKDDPSNMQWQTVKDGKAKDKVEGACTVG